MKTLDKLREQVLIGKQKLNKSCEHCDTCTHLLVNCNSSDIFPRDLPKNVLSLCKTVVDVSGSSSRTFSAPIHTTVEKFEFLRLSLPPALIRHENGAFRKRSSNQSN